MKHIYYVLCKNVYRDSSRYCWKGSLIVTTIITRITINNRIMVIWCGADGYGDVKGDDVMVTLTSDISVLWLTKSDYNY